MPSPLRLLVLEDRAADAELMLHELRRAGLAADWRRVETEADYVAALDPALDLILADYSLPQFNALRALQLLQQRGLDIPFIIVTGSISEEVAVECMKQGAADYLLKDRMTRLGQAVTHALAQKQLRDENRRAEQALCASEQKYRKLHESMIDGFVYVDMQGNIIDSNPSYQQMLGYSFEELTRLTYRDLTPEKWHAAEQAILDEQVLPRGYSDIYQKEYRRKDGTVFPIEIRAFLIKNEAGENEGMWAIVRDITERQRAEEALRASQQLLEKVLYSLRDAVFVVDAQTVKIFDCNPAASEIFGYDRDDMLGRTTDFLHVDQAVLEEFRHHLNSAVQETGFLHALEFRMKRRDGTIFPTEHSVTPLVDDAGNRSGWVSVVRDITERQRADEAIRDSERRERERAAELQTIMDVVPAAIWIAHDQMSQVITGNRASYELLHMPPQSNASITAPEGQQPTHFKVYKDGVELPPNELPIQISAATGVEIHDFEEAIVFDDGTIVHELGNVVPLFDEQGRPRGAVAAFVDITERKQAEEALRASERRERERAAELQTIMDTVPATIWIAHDQMSQVITGNRAAYELLRMPPGSNTSLTAPEGQRPTHSKIYQNGAELPPNELPIQISAATGVEIRDFEEEIVFDDGTVVHELGNVMPLFDEQGRPRGAVGAFIDITERKRMEAVLRESEAKHRRIVETSMEGILSFDADFHTILVNPRMAQMLGYAEEEMIGKPITDFMPESELADHEARTALRKQGIAESYERRFQHKSGRQVITLVSATSVLDEGGHFVGSFAMLTDITERKRAEEALREREARLSAIYSAAPVGIGVDVNRVIQEVNDTLCRITGYSREELVGQNSRFLFLAQEDYESVGREKYRLIAEHLSESMEARLKRKDGRIIDVLLSSVPLDAADFSQGVTFTVLDITERKRAEEALRASERRERERAAELQTIMDIVPATIWIAHDQMCQIVAGNRAAYESRRLPPDSNVSLTMPGNEVPTHYRIYRNGVELPPNDLPLQVTAATGVEIRDFEQNVVFDDGTAIHELGNVVPLFDEQGRPRGAVAAFLDITERKRAEEEIRRRVTELTILYESGLTFTRLLDPALIAQQIIKTLAHMNWHHAAIRLRRPGSDKLELQAFNQPGLQPQDQEAVKQHMQRLVSRLGQGMSGWVVQTGQPVRAGDLTEYPQYVETFPGIRSGLYVPLKVGNEVIGVIAIESEEVNAFGEHDERLLTTLASQAAVAIENAWLYEAVRQELAERKRMEAAVRESEEKYRNLVERANDGITIIQDFIVQYANLRLAEMWGGRAEKVIGTRFTDYIDPDELPKVAEHYRQRVAGEKIVPIYETVLRRRNGEKVHVELNAGVITYQGKPADLVIVRDITERKRMEQALHEKVIALQTLAEIDREIIAATEPQGILDLVCRRAAELVHAPKSAIVTRTAADEMEMTASYGLRNAARVSVEFAQFWQAGMMLPVVHETRATIAVNDVLADSSHMPEFQASENIRALVIVRLAAGEEILGALTVFDTAPREWNADELQILGLLAGQTAIAIEKARLFEAARDRALHLATLNEIGQAITSSLDLDRVLVTLLEKVRQATDAEACSVALVDKAAGDLVFRQAVGGATHLVIGLRLQLGQGIAGWVALHGQSILVPDAASDARSYKLDDSSGFVTRDLVGVPLIAHDAVIGVIELINKRSGRFGEDDRRLLESVAAQAAIAIENARLFETEHAGRQSLETLYRIGQAINSTLDADTILDRLTDEAMRTTHATHGSALVVRSDRGCFERRSLRGYSPEQIEQARSNWLPLDRGVNGRAYRLRQTVNVGDVYNDPDYYSLVPDTRSELAIPIMRGGQVIGSLDLQSPEVDAFRDVTLDFLQALTNQVAIALENARLFEETRRQMDEMSIVSQVALVGAAGRPFDETVARATDALSRLWPDMSLGFLFVDETGQSLHFHPSYHDTSPEIDAARSIPLDQGLTGWAVRERQPIRVGDVTADPRYIAKDAAVRSAMVAPMVVGYRSAARPIRAIGVINVESRRPDAFSGDDLRLLTTLAGELATIFEKARLDTALEAERASLARRVEERTAELRAANEQLRQAHEEVSRALGKEKELGELKTRFISMASHEFRTPLTTILSSAELLEHYSRQWIEDRRLEHFRRIQTATKNMMGLLDDVLLVGKVEAGKLEFTPAPINLDKFCRDMVEELRLGAAAKHSLVLTVQGDATQAHMAETLLRHILSNLLSNAIKYSPPGSIIQFELACREGQAVFQISDQGIGIPPEDQAHLFETFHRAANVRNIAGTGLGMAIVKRSVDLHGGTIDVASQVGVGTTVTVRLPLGTVSDEWHDARHSSPPRHEEGS